MTSSQTSQVVHLLRHAVLRHETDGLTDGQLLGCFLEQRDEASFAVLVRRHGPMVWGVCRRLLNHHDAEDAFQATFLVLFRKAASIQPRELVANWLYGVAYHAALQARRIAARRAAREKQVKEMPDPPGAVTSLWDDLRPILDQELSRLPDRYRVVLILSDLEGKTRKEVARLLGLAEGTIGSRLARARTMLARRLARHGLAVSGGALAAVLSTQATSACVPPLVVSSMIKAIALLTMGRTGAAGIISLKVAALTKGVLEAMLWTKVTRIIATVLVMAVLGLGGGVFVWQSQGSEHAAEQLGDGKSLRGKDQDIKKKLLELDELWWKGDVDTLRKLAADDLITVSGVGRYDKASLLEASKHRHAVDWTKRNVEVSLVSKDVAIVTYLYDCKVVGSDGTLFQTRRNRRFSMTWAKREGGWVVVFAQETIMPDGE